MTTKLTNVLAHLIDKSRSNIETSNARLTKMVYLADWHQAINHRRQITNIRWYFDNYGPFVWDVIKEAQANPEIFSVYEKPNVFGQIKKLIELESKPTDSLLSAEEIKSLNHVIEETEYLSWDKFIRLVYSTYPIVSSDRYTSLDLIKKAEEYKH